METSSYIESHDIPWLLGLKGGCKSLLLHVHFRSWHSCLAYRLPLLHFEKQEPQSCTLFTELSLYLLITEGCCYRLSLHRSMPKGRTIYEPSQKQRSNRDTKRNSRCLRIHDFKQNLLDRLVNILCMLVLHDHIQQNKISCDSFTLILCFLSQVYIWFKSRSHSLIPLFSTTNRPA